MTIFVLDFLLLKGLCHKMNIFKDDKICKNFLYIRVRWWFPNFFNSLLSWCLILKFTLASMKLLTYSKNFPVTIFRCSEVAILTMKTYMNPPVVLKNYTKSRLGLVNLRGFSCIQWGLETGEKGPMTGREAGAEIMMRLPEQSLEVRGFIEASKIFMFTFSLWPGILKILNQQRKDI